MAELLREITTEKYVPKGNTKKVEDLYETLEDENELYDDFENPLPIQG